MLYRCTIFEYNNYVIKKIKQHIKRTRWRIFVLKASMKIKGKRKFNKKLGEKVKIKSK